MSVVFTCAHCLIDGYDFSGQFTELLVNRSSESLDLSAMGVARGSIKAA